MGADARGQGKRKVSADFPELRASDADRDRVLDVLRAAVGDGRLTAEEFDERVEATLSSRTLGELAALTADLVAESARPDAVTARAEDVVRIDQRGGSVQRGGRWMVPQRLELRVSWCDVMLDFTEAVIVSDTLVIDMNGRGGALILVVGPGIVVDVGSLVVRYTDVDVRSGAEPGTPVRLRVRLTGRMRYGHVETR
jgi:Domain of unknown function (DUF1707)